MNATATTSEWWPSTRPESLGLTKFEEVDDEDQGLARGDDAAGALIAIAQVRRNHETATTSDFHAHNALVPTLDDVTLTEGEHERFTAVPGRVELSPLVTPMPP